MVPYHRKTQNSLETSKAFCSKGTAKPVFGMRNHYKETVEKTKARLVIPVHWDNFFASLEEPVEDMPE